VTLSQKQDWGYELQAALLVSSADGKPLAPLSLSLRAADGVHCSRSGKVWPPGSPLDELEPVMEFVERHNTKSSTGAVEHYVLNGDEADEAVKILRAAK